MTEAPENLMEVRGLLSQFGERTIHENLDLDLVRGEVLGVVGGSGAGKTVLLNTIIGLKEPGGGEVSLFGQDRSAMTKQEASAVERRTGVLFQQGALFSSLTVQENVEVPLQAIPGLTDVQREALAKLHHEVLDEPVPPALHAAANRLAGRRQSANDWRWRCAMAWLLSLRWCLSTRFTCRSPCCASARR